MKKKIQIISCLLAGALPLVGGIASKNVESKPISAESTTEQTPYAPTIKGETNQVEVALLGGNILEVVSNYEKYVTQDYYDSLDQFAPKPVTLNWTAEEGALYYNVSISKSKDMSNADTYMTFTNSLTVEDLFSGTSYYYQITAKYPEKLVKSCIFSFRTKAMTRTISIEGMTNTRDIGGYYVENGTKRIKQGMVYRGAKIEDATEAGKQKMLYEYGIKTDLDMRGEVAKSPLGDSVNFVNVSGPFYIGRDGIDSTNTTDKAHWKGTYREALLQEIRTFANPDNYPIYVHCSLGRDRTGTICFLINALCGVGEMDLFMDYELSFMSKMGNTDGGSPTKLVGENFTKLYNYIKEYGTGTMAENTEKFMLDIGITQEEIDAIREIMIEEVDA
ncbi:MAG: tyrosine-protein phosphatase [Clostridia bacterium]|nr:tyrosine-protein phosphatase [Clostridia bacterium]